MIRVGQTAIFTTIICALFTSCKTTAEAEKLNQPSPWTFEGGDVHGPIPGLYGWECWDGSRFPVQDECPSKPSNQKLDLSETIQCSLDGSMVFHLKQCPQLCPDGTLVPSIDQCPQRPPMPIIEPQCWDGTMVFHQDQCPIICPDGSKSTSEPPDYRAKCLDSSSELDK